MKSEIERYRILKVETGFERKYYVEYWEKFLWIFSHWVRCINPNHKEHFGTSFKTEDECREYISKAIKPVVKSYTVFVGDYCSKTSPSNEEIKPPYTVTTIQKQ